MNAAFQLAVGVALAAPIAWLAWRVGALTGGGALAAFSVGWLTFGFGGLWWAVALLLFFASSSGLSFLSKERKQALGEKFSKGKRRDAAQVLANGGLAALLAVVHRWMPSAHWVWAAFCGSLAAVNADTWGTEIGVLSKSPPRSILNGRIVPRGTSGAVSPLGIAASLGGALLLGLAAAAASPHPLAAGFAATVGGFIGAVVDSILGARWQATYFCPACYTETEHHLFHTCGAPTELIRGVRWLDNDMVNFAAALVGALLAAAVYLLGVVA